MRHHFEHSAHRVAGAIRLIHHRLHALLRLSVDAIQQHFLALAERRQLIPASRPLQLRLTHLDHMAQHADPQLL